jgi:hypothetical protein
VSEDSPVLSGGEKLYEYRINAVNRKIEINNMRGKDLGRATQRESILLARRLLSLTRESIHICLNTLHPRIVNCKKENAPAGLKISQTFGQIISCNP